MRRRFVMIPPMTALSVEPPPAASKSYLWVADPRQVSFFYAAKRKSPKKRPPRSHRPLRGFLCCAGMHECRGRRDAQERPLLARIGARLNRRAQTTRFGLEQEASDTPDSCCDARRWLRGPKSNTHLAVAVHRCLRPAGLIYRARPNGFCSNPRRSEPSTAAPPRGVARLLFEPEPRCLRPAS